MTEQSTNGPVNEAAFEATALERGAELSARVVRPQPTAEITAQATAGELVKRLELIEEAMRTAMKQGVDYGVVPGTEKPGLFKPGAEKLAVLFKLDVQPRNELIWGPGEHLTVISRVTVFHAPTGTRLGYGEGICSSRERNRAYRKQERTCPSCEQPAVIKGKEEYGGGYVCWHKKGGCGAKFPDGDQRIESQEVGEIENPDLPDQWNAVDKMSKKRGIVDAILSVTGASAIFTQDIGADPTEADATVVEHGPVVSGELHQQARQAAIRLCGGDVDHAKALWEKLQADLAGYMPEAAGRALLAAGSAVPAGGETRHRDATAAETGAASGTAARTGPAVATAPSSPPPAASGNPHGARLPAIAAARGVEDAELANLIRNAVAQGAIPADRARNALPEMLARITEEIAERTVELLDMFHPAAEGPREERPVAPETTSVDFGALEPPCAG
jgi:hypothetical protein